MSFAQALPLQDVSSSPTLAMFGCETSPVCPAKLDTHKLELLIQL